MLLKKQGFPLEDEMVMCTVTKVQSHSVFCNLDEYYRQGMIHISEVSPGRIRNLRDFVEEGKKVVCKVLRVSEEKGHIDLSLRRVNEGQKREKIDFIKQEQKAEKILEFVAKKEGKDVRDVFQKIEEKVLENYPNLYLCFQDIVLKNIDMDFLGLDKGMSKELEEMIKLRIKIPEVEIGGIFDIKMETSDGVNTIKKVLSDAMTPGIRINYLGAGKYDVDVIAPDYKQAEKQLKKTVDGVTAAIQKEKGTILFSRQDKK